MYRYQYMSNSSNYQMKDGVKKNTQKDTKKNNKNMVDLFEVNKEVVLRLYYKWLNKKKIYIE